VGFLLPPPYCVDAHSNAFVLNQGRPLPSFRCFNIRACLVSDRLSTSGNFRYGWPSRDFSCAGLIWWGLAPESKESVPRSWGESGAGSKARSGFVMNGPADTASWDAGHPLCVRKLTQVPFARDNGKVFLWPLAVARGPQKRLSLPVTKPSKESG